VEAVFKDYDTLYRERSIHELAYSEVALHFDEDYEPTGEG
jgi:hypothetical protein